jgi:hypothetical protein
MPRTLSICLSVLPLLLCGTLPAASTEDELFDCAKQNAPSKSIRQKIEFDTLDRMGNRRAIRANMSWARFGEDSRVMLRVHAPSDLNGAGLLLIEESERTDLFIYLPDLKKVKRVTSRMLSGSLFGSDFSYEDFMRVQGMRQEGRGEELPGTTLDGVEVRILAQYPAETTGSAYERIVSYWERESCIPIKTEMYEPGGKLRKVLVIDRESLFRSQGSVIPTKLEITDLRDETSTRLSIDDIELNGKISRKVFSTSGLERPGVF